MEYTICFKLTTIILGILYYSVSTIIPIQHAVWKNGVYNEYQYEGKIYDEPSVLGIEDSRISKLRIKKNNKTIINYDRGWDIPPNHSNHDIYEIIKDKLVNDEIGDKRVWNPDKI